MRVAVLFGQWSLSFRRSLDLATSRTDPRGLTGSELGCIRIAECLAEMGAEVTLHTVAAEVGTTWNGIRVKSIDEPIEPCDAVVSINEPDLLRAAPAGAFRVCEFFLNDVSFCKVGFQDHVDLFISPSAPHLRQVMTNPAWRQVEKTQEYPNGKTQYTPDPARWTVIELGCDPERYRGIEKIPGRVVHAASPDRGLHWLLQEWPAVKRAVPHATLHIFYRLAPWIRGFDQTPYFPPIEPLRDRAAYVEECLRRFSELPESLGVTLRDSVSRETIEREMAQAECYAFPCDTTTWSEGFSCATLEACAAGAIPVITNCDALGEVYGDAAFIARRENPNWQTTWRKMLITSLTNGQFRELRLKHTQRFADEHTWRRTTERLVEEIEKRKP